MQHLSGDQSVPPPRGYAGNALERFRAMAGHPATRRLAAMRAAGFSGLVPAQYAAHLSDPPELRERIPAPGFFVARAGGRKNLDAFLGELRAFARESGFMRWHGSLSEEIAESVASIAEAAPAAQLQTDLESLLGGRLWSRWRIVASGFYPNGGASWIAEPAAGLPEVFTVIGMAWEGFDTPISRPTPHVARDILDEAAYTAAYVMIELCRPFLPEAEAACGPGATDAEICIGRQLVDALVARALARVAPGAASPADAPRAGRLEQALRRYEKNRTEFPTVIDYAPELLGALTGGPAPACRFVDPERFQSEAYARRLGWYLELRLAAAPTEPLRRARAALRARRRPRP